MNKPQRTLNIEKTEILDLSIEGVPITVRVDANGWPLTVSAGCWLGGDQERMVSIALKAVRLELERAAERKAKAAFDTKRTDKSTKRKRKLAADHWSHVWIAKAREKYPKHGAERLAFAARRMLADEGDNHPQFAKRREITEHRAKQFLKAGGTA